MPSSRTLPPTMIRESFFCIDNGEYFPAYTTGASWNGWAMPYFTKEIADTRLCRERKDTDDERESIHMMYLPDQDAYKCLDDEEGDVFPGVDCLVDGEIMHLYPIGAGCWVWDEIALSCPHCDGCILPHEIGERIKPHPSGQLPRTITGTCPICGNKTSLRVI